MVKEDDKPKQQPMNPTATSGDPTIDWNVRSKAKLLAQYIKDLEKAKERAAKEAQHYDLEQKAIDAYNKRTMKDPIVAKRSQVQTDLNRKVAAMNAAATVAVKDIQRLNRKIKKPVGTGANGNPQLVGIEPNPGMPKKSQNKQKPKQKLRLLKKGPVGKQGPLVSVPVAVGRSISATKPQQRPSKNGIFVKFREFITSLNGANSTTLTSNFQFGINPARSNMFPYLSNIAILYEYYRFHKLQFHYEASAPSSDRGEVIMSVEYEPNAPAIDEQILTSSHTWSRDKAWSPFTLNCDRGMLMRTETSAYHRISGQIPTSEADKLLYDVGIITVANDVSTSSGKIGALYVDYEVELISQHFDQSLLAGISEAGQDLSSRAAMVDATLPLLGGLPVTITTNTITFNNAFRGFLMFGAYAASTISVSTSTATLGASRRTDNAGASSTSFQEVTASKGQTIVFTTLTTGNQFWYLTRTDFDSEVSIQRRAMFKKLASQSDYTTIV